MSDLFTIQSPNTYMPW